MALDLPLQPGPPMDAGTGAPPPLGPIRPESVPPAAPPADRTTLGDRPARSARTGRERAALAIAVVVMLAACRPARGILVPMALAGLFAFLLAPLAARLERLRLGRAVSAILSVLVLVACVGGLAWLPASQAFDLASRLPECRRTIEEKVGTLRSGGVAAPLAEAGADLEAATLVEAVEAARRCVAERTQVAPEGTRRTDAGEGPRREAS